MVARAGARRERIVTRDTCKTLVLLLTSAVGAATMQVWTGWWLNSGTGVAWTIAMLFLLAAVVGATNSRSPWTGPVALWAGSMSGLTLSLFRIGPGAIWPIVLLVSSVLTAGTIMVGLGVHRVWAWLTDGGLRMCKCKKFLRVAYRSWLSFGQDQQHWES
jgi:hypothetical protein